MLRAYEGIFDYPASISELLLARLLGKDVADIKKDLSQLHHYGIIDYQPQKDGPQLFFLKDRVNSAGLSINKLDYAKRKEKLAARIKEMIRFVLSDTQCRSKMIGVYFGDKDMNNCGICDNCLRLKAVSMSKEEFERIHQTIVATLQDRSLRAKELLGALTGIKKEKAWKVIEFLQAENKIEMDSAGLVRLK